MTPDDVVARALTLDGKEADLTIRGVVRVITLNGRTEVSLVRNSLTYDVTIANPITHASPDLVSIQPAPLRIEPGELYADGQGIVYVGISEHEARAVTGACPGSVTTSTWALRRVKVVDA